MKRGTLNLPSLRMLRCRQSVVAAAVAAVCTVLAILAMPTASLAAPVAGIDVRVNNPVGDGSSAGFTQNNAAVLTFGSTVLVGYSDSGSLLGGTNNGSGWSRSTDGGRTFSDLGKLPLGPGGGEAGSPTLARDAVSGTVYLSAFGWAPDTINVFKSSDGGATFAAPVNAAAGAPSWASFGTPRMVVDNVAGALQGTLYVAARDFSEGGDIHVYRSTDGGSSFKRPGGGGLATDGHNVVLTVLNDHSLLAAWYDQASGSIVTRRSTDGGEGFDAAVTAVPHAAIQAPGGLGDLALTGQRSGVATRDPFNSHAAPQIVTNPVSGQLMMVYAGNPSGADRADVFLVTSDDRGATWSAPLRINGDATGNDQWRPTLAITPDGQHAGIFWYDRRGDSANNRIAYWGRVCELSGFEVDCSADDFQVSDVDFLPEFGRDSSLAEGAMGMFDTVSADNDAFFVAWGDNRDEGPAGRRDPNVYFDRIVIDQPAAGVAAPGGGWLAGVGLACLVAARRRRPWA